MNNLVSVIIRTKNEERWIAQVLRAVFRQTHKELEVIIVDNESADKTLEKARQFPIYKVVGCKDYLPGRALNLGIQQARGEHIVSLSGHCIPVNERWLEKLLENLQDVRVAGVYGRQEAMAFTADSDKRDLALIFGLDRRVQLKDSFFHNANSIFRRQLWQQIPFDDKVTNIEDRMWAQAILDKGYKIVYEPEASVYHYHGIHQNGDVQRCSNVVRILESLHGDYSANCLDANKLNVVAVIPVRGEIQYLKGRPLLAYTVEKALESRYINKTIVATDNKELAALARDLGAEAPFIRQPELSREDVDLGKVLQFSLERIEQLGIFADLIVPLEVTFPFRPRGLLDDMITQLARYGFDSVIAARTENRSMWQQKEGTIIQIDEGITPRQFKEPAFIGLKGIGSVTHPEFLRKGALLGPRVGIYEVNNPYSHLEVRSKEDFDMAVLLMDNWVNLNK